MEKIITIFGSGNIGRKGPAVLPKLSKSANFLQKMITQFAAAVIAELWKQFAKEQNPLTVKQSV